MISFCCYSLLVANFSYQILIFIILIISLLGTHIHLSNLSSYTFKVLNVVFVLLLFNRKIQMHQLEISKLKIILNKLPIWLENNIKLLCVLTLKRRNWKENSADKLLMFKRINKLLFFDILYFIPGKGYDKYIS